MLRCVYCTCHLTVRCLTITGLTEWEVRNFQVLLINLVRDYLTFVVSNFGRCRICKTMYGSDIEILFDIVCLINSILIVILINRINDLLYLRKLNV